MMENSQQVDDIGRLLRELDLDRGKYREFKGGVSALMRLPPAPDQWEDEPEISANLVAGGPRERPEPMPRAEVKATIPPSPVEIYKQLPPGEQDWSVLESLLNLSAKHSVGQSHPAETKSLAVSGTTLFGACGGVGTTTIVSALGRIAAKNSHSVLLVDTSSPSFLPLYFGAQSPRSFVSTFDRPGRFREQPVHVACGNVEDLVRQFGTEIDRFYVDGGLFKNGEADFGSYAHLGSGTSIVVLAPDVRCLAELNRLQRRQIRIPHLLLSQFDSDQALHNDIQSLLKRQFADRLIPVRIGHDHDVSAALAQGTTIVDYSPDSAVANDLHRLHEWLAANCGKAASLERSLVGCAL